MGGNLAFTSFLSELDDMPVPHFCSSDPVNCDEYMWFQLCISIMALNSTKKYMDTAPIVNCLNEREEK